MNKYKSTLGMLYIHQVEIIQQSSLDEWSALPLNTSKKNLQDEVSRDHVEDKSGRRRAIILSWEKPRYS